MRQWVAEGFQVFCVQESCGFGFVLHRELVAAGAQSFLITPIALNGKRKTDKLDARALCLRFSRWLDGNRDELAPIRIPTETEQRQREGTRRRKFLKRESAAWPIAGTARSPSIAINPCPPLVGPRNWQKLSPKVDPWVLGVLAKLRDLILALEAQLKALEEDLASASRAGTPKGLGELTLVAWTARCATGHAFITANRSAATPAVVRANTVRAANGGWAALTGWATAACARCWSRRCGAS